MTSVNTRVSTSSDDEEIEVPKGFFFNIEALNECVPDLEDSEDQFAIVPVPRHAYDSARKNLALQTMLESGSHPRDDREATNLEAQYEWKILVPSAEDVEGIKCILKANLLTRKEATALLMVDFWCVTIVPSTARYNEGETNFGSAFTKVVQTAASGLDEGSPEAEYIRFMDDPGDLTGIVTKKLRDYVASINKKLQSPQAPAWVEKYLKVAESKRRMFRPPPRSGRPSNPLAEFEMALPYARKMEDDLDPWEMTADGGAAQVPTSKAIWHPSAFLVVRMSICFFLLRTRFHS
ncbi:hypothetical protein P154DRAFT_577808 [Amniculicola lignicola CBS 123094]|uniref:Uncharacterized protein n=1 Tax=Amniculicola lignicola CBS 123094 TaxID=1392246 RepID=A0A6A5WE90_9PLEO|nr:hypothetical protein P154DRAFT_577808 [Amniculicola lignicola CBS 123094]